MLIISKLKGLCTYQNLQCILVVCNIALAPENGFELCSNIPVHFQRPGQAYRMQKRTGKLNLSMDVKTK